MQTYKIVTDSYKDLPMFTSSPFEATSDAVAIEMAMAMAKTINPGVSIFALNLFRINVISKNQTYLGKITPDLVMKPCKK